MQLANTNHPLTHQHNTVTVPNFKFAINAKLSPALSYIGERHN